MRYAKDKHPQGFLDDGAYICATWSPVVVRTTGRPIEESFFSMTPVRPTSRQDFLQHPLGIRTVVDYYALDLSWPDSSALPGWVVSNAPYFRSVRCPLQRIQPFYQRTTHSSLALRQHCAQRPFHQSTHDPDFDSFTRRKTSGV